MGESVSQYVSDQLFTPEEYLLMEAEAEYRSEYSDGKIVAMTGGSPAHSGIIANLLAELVSGLRGDPCRAFSGDLRFGMESLERYYYPDAMVICGDLIHVREQENIVENPIVVFEVLSQATEHKDRGEKFHAYWTLPTLQEYVLVSQKEPMVEIFSMKGEGIFQLQVFRGMESHFPLQSLGIELTMRDLYEKISFKQKGK